MSLGLLTRASSEWRRVIGIGDQGVVCVTLCHWDWCLRPHSAASTGGSLRSGEPKRLIFRGRACTELSFLAFAAGPGSGGSKRLIFKGRACTNRHFWPLVRVRALADQNGSFLKAGLV